MCTRSCPPADLLAITENDPFVRSQSRYRFGRAWRYGRETASAVAFVSLDTSGQVRHLAAVGDPESAAAMVTVAVREVPEVPRLSLPRGTLGYLPAWLGLERPTDWDFRSTTIAPPPQAGEERACWLEEVDGGDVKELLVQANPETSVWPGEAKVRRWAGIRDVDGRLHACLADTGVQDVGHFSGIATHPEARGQGLATAITAWATRRHFEEGSDLVTLGMYANNSPARRVYDRLRFTDDHPFTSGVVSAA